MGIKRYDVDEVYTDLDEGHCYADMEDAENGKYVTYQDHLQVFKELEEKITELEKLNESMLKRNCVNCNLFGEGCFLACGEAGLCFCNDWQPKEQD